MGFQDSLGQIEEDIAPLLTQLKLGETLEKGESKFRRRATSAKRTCQDGFSIDEVKVLDQLDRMASLAAEQKYTDAHAAYMKLTLGQKTWNNTIVTHVSANTMQGAREYRRNRDSLNTYDVDPVAQKYMHAMKKIIRFAQCMRPNKDESK